MVKEEQITKEYVDKIKSEIQSGNWRSLRDFAIPFKKEEEIFWRYHTIKFEQINIPKIEKKQELKQEEPEIPKSIIQETRKQIETSENKEKENKEDLDIKKETKKSLKKKLIKTNSSQKTNEKFFNKVKEFLSKKEIEILDIISFSKNDLILKVIKNGKGLLLAAYNKKRINEEDIIKVHKKSKELDLKYTILCLGEPLKKLNTLIEAIKDLEEIEKIEE